MASEFIKAHFGKCRVPMWSGIGYPDGFCDKPAFGEYIDGPTFRDGWTGEVHRRDGKWRGYVHGPCCPSHGGPDETGPRAFRDGTHGGRPMWCAVYEDFENLQESPAEFGVSPWVAIEMLEKRHPRQ
jgi:hypothetical protein